MAQIRWTPQALDDLDAVCLFIARDAPHYAAVMADRVFEATHRLSDHPRSGRIVPETNVDEIRELIVGNYRVVYRLDEGSVQILTVQHGARELRIGRG